MQLEHAVREEALPLAWIQKGKAPSGRDRWRACWRDPVGSVPRRYHSSRWFDRERAAKQERGRVEREEEGRARPPKRQQHTVESLIRVTIGLEIGEGRGYMVSARDPLGLSTEARYRSVARSYVVPAIGARRLSDVTVPMAQAFFNRLERQNVGQGTIAMTRRMLSALFAGAVREGHVLSNPISGIELAAPDEREPRYLQVEEIDRLVNVIPSDADRTLVLMLSYCGLRFGEAAALHVQDIDLERRRIMARASLSEVNGHLIEGKTKTRRIRAVRIPALLVPLLGEQLREKTPDARVFTGSRGHDLRIGNWRTRVFYPAVSRARLDEPRPRIQDLRHTAASLAIASGAHPKTVSEMLGHASIGITMDRYGHLFDSLQDEAGDRLDAYLMRERERKSTVADVAALRSSP
jgi:integrase